MPLKLNDTQMEVKLYTGAQANVISEAEFKKIRPRPKIDATKVKVSGYAGAEIPVKGKCMVKVTHIHCGAKECAAHPRSVCM